MHKVRCTPHYFQQQLEDPDLYKRNKAFSNWLNCWKFLLNDFALQTLDIYGHGGDYSRAKTHSMILFIEPREDSEPGNYSTTFSLVKAEVLPWTAVMDRIRNGARDIDEEELKAIDFDMAGKQFQPPAQLSVHPSLMAQIIKYAGECFTNTCSVC
jgi:hypothetical protein